MVRPAIPGRVSGATPPAAARTHDARPFEEAVPLYDVVLVEEGPDIAGQLRILLAQRRHPLLARVAGQLERLVEAQAGRTPAGGSMGGMSQHGILHARAAKAYGPSDDGEPPGGSRVSA